MIEFIIYFAVSTIIVCLICVGLEKIMNKFIYYNILISLLVVIIPVLTVFLKIFFSKIFIVSTGVDVIVLAIVSNILIRCIESKIKDEITDWKNPYLIYYVLSIIFTVLWSKFYLEDYTIATTMLSLLLGRFIWYDKINLLSIMDDMKNGVKQKENCFVIIIELIILCVISGLLYWNANESNVSMLLYTNGFLVAMIMSGFYWIIRDKCKVIVKLNLIYMIICLLVACVFFVVFRFGVFFLYEIYRDECWKLDYHNKIVSEWGNEYYSESEIAEAMNKIDCIIEDNNWKKYKDDELLIYVCNYVYNNYETKEQEKACGVNTILNGYGNEIGKSDLICLFMERMGYKSKTMNLFLDEDFSDVFWMSNDQLNTFVNAQKVVAVIEISKKGEQQLYVADSNKIGDGKGGYVKKFSEYLRDTYGLYFMISLDDSFTFINKGYEFQYKICH